MFGLFKSPPALPARESKPKQGEDVSKEERMRMLEAIAAAMPDPYYVRDMDYNILYWPPSIAKLTGYSEEEAKKLKCYEVYKADVCQDCPTQKCVLQGRFLKDAAVDIFDKQGNRLNILVSNAGIYDEQGKPIGAVEIVKDNRKHQQVMHAIDSTAQQLSALSRELATSSQEVAVHSGEVNHLSQSTKNLTGESLEKSKVVQQQATQCVQYSGNIASAADDIRSSMQTSLTNMLLLEKKSTEVKDITSIIENIAGQTNLLALNAAIEAARAGEQGRGFAVVAEEVRKLAEMSSRSVKDINTTLSEIGRLVQVSTEALKATGESLNQGTENIQRFNVFITEIAAASNSLVATMQQVNQFSNDTFANSSNRTDAMEQVSKAARELSHIAQSLQSEIAILVNDKM
ncbi:PAS domain S-box protein [Heliobacterium gestii]|uniref:PAS domain S-box protein n=1 Tax=Heliomicrobium gestii TaxID=2699 RepID=A0A845LHM3_HELGE|nr:methyl-accepting chemotaxis protein [Heliomicrobium gestii]MBM7866943.1 PAS domain S-box-containing protein [Heliomicrobium gestii]MZP42366.1 PAS domain S-box protein [Heliomicrobium gestii]